MFFLKWKLQEPISFKMQIKICKNIMFFLKWNLQNSINIGGPNKIFQGRNVGLKTKVTRLNQVNQQLQQNVSNEQQIAKHQELDKPSECDVEQVQDANKE